MVYSSTLSHNRSPAADGFGMAVPKGRLPEDVLEYLLFPKLQEGLEEKDVISVLEKCYDTYLGHLGPRIINYIWQNDGFTLRTVLGQGKDEICHSLI